VRDIRPCEREYKATDCTDQGAVYCRWETQIAAGDFVGGSTRIHPKSTRRAPAEPAPESSDTVMRVNGKL